MLERVEGEDADGTADHLRGASSLRELRRTGIHVIVQGPRYGFESSLCQQRCRLSRPVSGVDQVDVRAGDQLVMVEGTGRLMPRLGPATSASLTLNLSRSISHRGRHPSHGSRCHLTWVRDVGQYVERLRCSWCSTERAPQVLPSAFSKPIPPGRRVRCEASLAWFRSHPR